MVERGLCAHAHELPRADFDHRHARIVVEMWNEPSSAMICGEPLGLQCTLSDPDRAIPRWPIGLRPIWPADAGTHDGCADLTWTDTACCDDAHHDRACLAAGLFALAAAVCVPRGLEADDLLVRA